MPRLKVGVILGGMSTEHTVSVTSGTSIIKNLDKQIYEIFPIYISGEGNWFRYLKNIEEIDILSVGELPQELEQINGVVEYLKQLDVIFPVLHGLYGEDGTIQGLFELLKIPYVGCGVLSSSISMDKAYAKQIAEKAKVNQAKYIYIKHKKGNYILVDNQFNEEALSLEEISKIAEEQLGFPVFVKPSNSGSSVGINKAHNKEELIKSIKDSAQYDTKILIEENIKGREIECAVLGNTEVEASCVGEVLSAETFYTFDAKYKNVASKTVIPAEISTDISAEIRKAAIKIFKAVDGKGLARVDFFVQEDTQEVYFNELNTMPGFTEISMYPKLCVASGMTYSELLDKLINYALEKN